MEAEPKRDGAVQPSVALVAASLEIVGGQGVQADALRRHLVAEGLDVGFVPINPRLPPPVAAVRQIPYLRTLVNEVWFVALLARLRSYDVVHLFCASYWSFLLTVVPVVGACKLLRKPLLLNYHSGEAADHLAHWGVWVHPWLRQVDRIVVPSEYLRGVFARFGYTVDVVPNILARDAFPYRERRQVQPRLLSNRNLEAHYGVDTVIEAFARLRRSHPEAQLTVAGWGSQGRRLVSHATALGESGIAFLGQLPPHAMRRLYATHDIFVNASVVDNQPVSILEAFASGLPVVSTPTGDIRNLVVHERTGLLVPPRKPTPLAEAVERLLQAPQHARRLARAAYAGLERFTWPAVRAGWLEVYQQLAAAASSKMRARRPNRAHGVGALGRRLR